MENESVAYQIIFGRLSTINQTISFKISTLVPHQWFGIIERSVL